MLQVEISPPRLREGALAGRRYRDVAHWTQGPGSPSRLRAAGAFGVADKVAGQDKSRHSPGPAGVTADRWVGSLLERQLFLHGAMVSPLSPSPYFTENAAHENADIVLGLNDGDPHRRSIAVVTGYHIHASDGQIGHVENFLIDDATWGIRYLVIDTRNWWPGKHVLVSPSGYYRSIGRSAGSGSTFRVNRSSPVRLGTPLVIINRTSQVSGY